MKNWHKLIFCILAVVLLYRGYEWLSVRLQEVEPKQIYSSSSCLIEFAPHSKRQFNGGYSLKISGLGCTIAVVSFWNRDRAIIGCCALTFISLTTIFGWRRRSWKLVAVGIFLVIAYGIGYEPWVDFKQIPIQPRWMSDDVYSRCCLWIWCHRIAAIGCLIALVLASVSIPLMWRFRKPPRPLPDHRRGWGGFGLTQGRGSFTIASVPQTLKNRK